MENQSETWVSLFKALSILGALLLWCGFFLLGVIARRYEVVFRQFTGWKPLMGAPSGILVYVAIISAQTFSLHMSEDLQKALDILAYGALLVSAGASFWMVRRFHAVLVGILEPRKES